MKRCSIETLITENTLDLLQTRNISNLRVEDIIKESSISKRTFYLHFKDKYDVVCSIYDKYLDFCWGVNDTRQNLPGYIKRASSIWEGEGRDSIFIKNTMSYDGQNSLSEHIIEKGIYGIERLLCWNHREDLITLENRTIIEFWMRGMDAMYKARRNGNNLISFEKVGIDMYKLFPSDLLDAVMTIPTYD